MTPFLLATLIALVVGGALFIVWRDYRVWFRRALGGVVGAVLLVGIYVWWVGHAHEVLEDPALVTLNDLQIENVAGSYRVRGQIRNVSKDRVVSAVPMRLLVEDCSNAAASANTGAAEMSCERVQEAEQHLVISIPAGESRNFVLTFNVPSLPAALRAPGVTLRIRVEHDGPRTHKAVVR